jgi:hypothetical protein
MMQVCLHKFKLAGPHVFRDYICLIERLHSSIAATKQTHTYARQFSQTDTRLHTYMRTDMHSLKQTCWKLRVLAGHDCPRFELQVRYNARFHACSYSRLNAHLQQRTFDARRNFRNFAFELHSRYYKTEFKVLVYTRCRPDQLEIRLVGSPSRSGRRG